MYFKFPPSDQDRARDYDSFEVMGRRMDVFSFSALSTPFNATCLGHYWSNSEDINEHKVLNRLKPSLCLINSGQPDDSFLKKWGLISTAVDQKNMNEYIKLGDQFANGDLSDESELSKRMLSPEKTDDWVAQLFTDKAWQLLQPVIASARTGNRQAIESISFLTQLLTDSLEKITKENLLEVREVASRRLYWPVLHTPHSQLKTNQQDSYIANLTIGSKLPVRVDRSRWKEDSMSMLVLELITFVDSYRSNNNRRLTGDPIIDTPIWSELGEMLKGLPALNKQTARSDWWPVIKSIFAFSYPDPISVDQFCDLVEHRQDSPANFKSAFNEALREKLISLSI